MMEGAATTDRAAEATPSAPFGGPLSRSVWRWQFALAFSGAAIAAVVALLEPEILALPTFFAGMSVLVTVTIVGLLVPWDVVGRRGILAMPAVDIAVVGLLSATTDLRVGFLWVMPISWIATYYSLGWIAAALGFVAVSVLIPAMSSPFSNSDALRLLVVLVSLGFIATVVSVGASRGRATHRLLRRQSEQLARTLERARQQEQRTRLLLDSLSSGVAQIDSAGAVRTANRAYRHLYGDEDAYASHPAPAVEYRSRRGDITPPRETTIARATRGEAFDGEEAWLFDAEGRWRAIRAAAHHAPDASGDDDDAMILVVEEVTEERNAEHVRTSMARAISHELRNPLTAILGHADLLIEHDGLPADVHEKLTIIDAAALRMERLISSILEDGAQDMLEGAVEFDLIAVLSASVAGFSAVADAAGVTLTAAMPDELRMTGDAFRMRQVVDNVIGNAVKYTPRGGRVAVGATSDTDGGISVSVSDTGIGMSIDDVARVTAPYFRAASAREAGLPGTGLGMRIAHEIVAAHDGTIDISSEIGRGTRIDIRFAGERTEEA